jgi:photosystem II stability/assembly factor-like uncharacterized protein
MGLTVLILVLTLLYARMERAAAVTVPRAPLPASVIAAPYSGDTYQGRPVAIGGGGFITGLGASANGAGRVARADVYGAYRWIAALDRWVQLINSDSMPAVMSVQDGGNEGVYEIVIAPSDPNRIYMAFKGTMYRSDDGGAKFIEIPLLQNGQKLVFDANGKWRHYGPLIAVSPTQPDLVFFGTPANGFWRSADGGHRWSMIDTVPNAAISTSEGDRPGNPVWIAPSVAAGRPEVVWVMAQGTGMMRSQDGGIRFDVLCGSCKEQPANLRQGAFTPAKTFIGVNDFANTVWRYRDGKWEELTRLSGLRQRTYASVAVDPASNQVYLFDEGGAVMRSSDDGDTWETLGHKSEAGKNDPPWLRVSNQSYFATSQVNFDPVVPHRLWVAAGTGVFYADMDPASAEVRWISQSRGIEELVANDVIQPPGRAPLFAAWDFGIHVKEDLDAYSITYGPKERVLIAAQQVDYSVSAPDFIVTNASDTRTTCCSEDGDAVLAGYSINAGRTWTKFPTLPQPPGTRLGDPWRMSFGTIAVSSGDSENIIWQPSNNRAPFFTKNRGRSWERVAFSEEVLPYTGSHAVYSYARKTLAADRAKSGVFYLYHSGETPNRKLQGLWRTNTGGSSWQKVFNGEIAPLSQYSAKLRAVPGRPGHLFFTSGVTASPDNSLRRSVDGGVSWLRLPSVQRADDIAFGKAAAGKAYPTIFVSAQLNGVYGIWRSTDEAATWQSVASFPVGTLDQVTVLGADPDVFGRVYVGYKGSGWRYGEPAPCRAQAYVFPANAECFGVK